MGNVKIQGSFTLLFSNLDKIESLQHTMKAMVFLAIITAQLTCAENKNLNGRINQTFHSGIQDTLKFTSGIRSILQDSKGNYWIGSDQEGVCRYDGKSFTYYTPENGFCGKQVIYIGEDEKGRIWFGTSTGLCCFDGLAITFPGNEIPVSPWKVQDGDLWFPGNQDGEILRINKGSVQVHKNPIVIPPGKNPRDYGITGFSKSRNGGIWIAYYDGVVYYDGDQLISIDNSTMNFTDPNEYLHVRSILEDSKGRLWIGNNGIGVQLMQDGVIKNFSKEHHLFMGEIFKVKSPPGTLMHVFAIKEDTKGNIWFGDRDTGAWKYDGKNMTNYVLDGSLKKEHIWDIYEDKKGNLFFASGDKGIYKFNGNGFDRFL